MRTSFKIALATVVDAVIGAASVQGLHAQAKPKACQVAEFEHVGDISSDYLTKVRTAMGPYGYSLRTLKGRTPIEGSALPPNGVYRVR